jgi:hypothetical protein
MMEKYIHILFSFCISINCETIAYIIFNCQFYIILCCVPSDEQNFQHTDNIFLKNLI